MKIDVTTVLTSARGEPLLPPAAEGADPASAKPMTLGEVIVMAFETPMQTDTTADVGTTLAKHRLAKRIAAATGELEITSDEAALIRERVLRSYYLPVSGPVIDLLEG